MYFGVVNESGFSFVVVGLFLAGIVGVFVTWILFVNGGGYRRLRRPLTPVESEAARREVDRRLSDLAPRTILLAEKLRAVDEALMQGSLDEERWVRVERLSREAPAAGVWRRYSAASALAGEQPLEALEELRDVEWMVETALSRLEEARQLCNVGERAS
jgi:hypothetical protein